MKVYFDLNHDKVKNNRNGVSFGGIKPVKSEDGFKTYEFSYPFDEDHQKLFLEIYAVTQDKNNNYAIGQRIYPQNSHNGVYQLKTGSNRIDLAQTFGIDDNQAFAYHYVVENNHTGQKDTMLDPGDMVFDNQKGKFNLEIPTKSNLSRGGSMKLINIDSQKVGKVYNDKNMIVDDVNLLRRAQKGIKTLNNKFGGTMAGLQDAVRNGEYDMYGRIISLPVFTDDDFTAHAYWNKNCMQSASSLGNINNYASLQRDMFAHGLNFVSDGAFVNEGLQGVHFKHMLKWGENSPYFNWFKASGLKNSPLNMGVFVKNKANISHKIVNSPYTYTQKQNGKVSISANKNYDSKRPTYIQFFDKRLVTDEEKNDTKHLIKTYSVMSPENVYSIHTHNDSVYPYSFEIDPKIYNENIERLNEYNSTRKDGKKISLSSPLAARIVSKFPTFDVEAKYESGFETWDANPDIAKLSFVYSHADTKDLKNLPKEERKKEIEKRLSANYQVQDYTVTSGQYWTQKTDDILRLSIAQQLKNIDYENPSLTYKNIKLKSNGQIFPKSLPQEITQEEVNNVIDGFYNSTRKLSTADTKSQVLEGLMNTPLDSFEFGDNLVAVLASPLISKRATNAKDVGVSRYDLYKQGNKNLQLKYKETYEKMDNLYKNEMSNYAMKVLETVQQNSNVKLFEGDKVTELGQYTLPLILPEIAKYAVVESLAPKVKVNVDDTSGEIAYDYNSLKNVHLQSLGITNPSSPEDEADMVISKMRKGISNLSVTPDSPIVKSIEKSLNGTSANSFKLADLIIDKTQSGLDWRIDATKDIADIEALRNGNNNFDYTWQSVINFWKAFNQGVLSKNPNAYTVAEITDEGDLHRIGLGHWSDKFNSQNDIIQKFQRETGITSTAMYSYFFSDLQEMFANKFEDGSTVPDGNPGMSGKLYGIMDSFLKHSSLDSINFAYTFIGNHDKPRAIHCASMDMKMFYADLTNPDEKDKRYNAYKMIKDRFFGYIDPREIEEYDFSAVSPKAVSMGYAVRTPAIQTLEKYRNEGRISEEQFNQAFASISKSISDLVNGKYDGTRFDPDSFGVKPFDVTIKMVIKQAQKRHNLNLPQQVLHDFENDTFQQAIEPGITRLLGMMKFLVALPGMPTLYDGDDMGATGYDTKTKNMYLQGRQRVHDEWAQDGNDLYKAFIKKHKKEFDDIMAVRKKPECNALNNGTPFMLPPQHATNGQICPAILRQSTDGRMAISIFNPTGFVNDTDKDYSPQHVRIDSINLNCEKDVPYLHNGTLGRGIQGLKQGTEFVNANNPNDVYYVREKYGTYYLKRLVDGNDSPIDFSDSTLILYSVPEGKPLSFTGRMDVKLPFKFVARNYENSCNVENGKNLILYK